MEVIQIDSKIYQFPKTLYETEESYSLRRDFFIKVYPETEKEYLNALNMSYVWSYMKILGCVYPPEVVEHINKMFR